MTVEAVVVELGSGFVNFSSCVVLGFLDSGSGSGCGSGLGLVLDLGLAKRGKFPSSRICSSMFNQSV